MPYVGKQVAIELDGVVQSAPEINPGITGRDVQITGDFSARARPRTSRSCCATARCRCSSTSTADVESVSPTLGKDQLHAGIVAGLIGLALVALYMILYYRLLGLVVV